VFLNQQLESDEAFSTRRLCDWWHIVRALSFSAEIKALKAQHEQGCIPVCNYDWNVWMLIVYK